METNILKLKDIYSFYKQLNEKLCNEMTFPDKITMDRIKNTFLGEFKDTDIKVKCDNENNPPDIIMEQCLIARICYNFMPGGNIYNYVDLIFGSKKKILRIQNSEYFLNLQ